jgi:hypothetical protein
MTTQSLPNPMFMPTANSRAGSMHAFTNEATRPSEAIVNAARWNWRRRRIHFLLRNFARALASGMTDVRHGPLKALHDSRSLLAARVIDEHRHLIRDYRCIGALRCVDDASPERRPAEFLEQ